MILVTVRPDLPNEAKGVVFDVDPATAYHLEQVFPGPRLITITTMEGRVVVTVAEPPAAPPAPAPT